MMIIIEMIYNLSILQLRIVNIAYFSGPFEIKEWRFYLLIFNPSFCQKGSSKFFISSFDNKNFLIVPNSVSSLPSGHIMAIFEFRLFSIVSRTIIFFLIVNFVFTLLFQLHLFRFILNAT